MGWWLAIFALPPHVAVISERDVGVKRVVRDRSHRVWIRFVARARHDAEITVLGIYGVQPAISNLHPRDVVADGRHLPALEMIRRNEHGEIRFAAGAWESSGNVMFFSFRRFHAQDQHVLGEPALFARQIRTNPQSKTLFA